MPASRSPILIRIKPRLLPTAQLELKSALTGVKGLEKTIRFNGFVAVVDVRLHNWHWIFVQCFVNYYKL